MVQKLFAASAAVLLGLAVAASVRGADLKPRIIVLTDIAPINVEPDDMESMIRLMAHADLFEIDGLVATTGWSNSGGKEHPDIIQNVIDAYEKDLPDLRKRSGQEKFLADETHQQIGYWPSPDYLRAHTVVGSKKQGYKFIGKDNDSAGSDLIIKAADEKDERPIYVLVWGGANTLAQAIWHVQQDRTPEQLKTFLHKIRTYTITDQDRPQTRGNYEFSSHFWMRDQFKDDLTFIWDESAWTFQNNTGKSNWTKYAELIQNHGNLGAIYPKYKYGVEGDTPSYLYVWPNGLNDPEHPEYGGWGATFAKGLTMDGKTVAYNNHNGTEANATSKKYEPRFYPAIFNSFVSRMDWAKNGTGNRNPAVIVNGTAGLASLHLAPPPGSSVTLDASASTDPDGDKLTYAWWVMPEAGSYKGEIKLTGETAARATVQVPADAEGKDFHVICEVTDSGTPPLTSYRRVIVSPQPQNATR